MYSGKLDGRPLCPGCGKLLDGFTVLSVVGLRPAAGDLSVCFYCLLPLQFTDDPDIMVPFDIITATESERKKMKDLEYIVRKARRISGSMN